MKTYMKEGFGDSLAAGRGVVSVLPNSFEGPVAAFSPELLKPLSWFQQLSWKIVTYGKSIKSSFLLTIYFLWPNTEIPCPAPLLRSHLSHSIRNLSQRFHLVLHCNASLPDTVLRVFTSRPAGFRARPFPQALQKTVAAEDRHRCEDHSEIPEVVTGLGSPHTAIPGKPVWINQRKVPGAVSVPLSTGDAGISHTLPRKEGKL